MSDTISDTMSDTISVIIPVYNGAAYLAEALASVRAQTHPPSEILVIDDGSTDGSADLAEQLGATRVLRQTNCGVAATRNRGIAAAAGSLLAFLDQDDYWVPDKLALQLHALREEPALYYVTTRQRWFVEAGQAPPSWLQPGLVDRPLPGWMPGTVLMRRAAIDQVGLFDEAFPVASDVRWFFQAKDAGLPQRMLDAVLVHKRIHGHNQSSRDYRHELLEIVRQSIRERRSRTQPQPDTAAVAAAATGEAAR